MQNNTAGSALFSFISTSAKIGFGRHPKLQWCRPSWLVQVHQHFYILQSGVMQESGLTSRLSMVTNSTLLGPSRGCLECTISCLVEYCRYTVLPRTCSMSHACAICQADTSRICALASRRPGLKCALGLWDAHTALGSRCYKLALQRKCRQHELSYNRGLTEDHLACMRTLAGSALLAKYDTMLIAEP